VLHRLHSPEDEDGLKQVEETKSTARDVHCHRLTALVGRNFPPNTTQIGSTEHVGDEIGMTCRFLRKT